MKAFLILEDGHVFTGTSIGSAREVISEIVFNTSMTGYLEVMTDPSYAGQAVCMTYPLIGNYGICYDDQESRKPWIDGFIVRELSRVPSNFRSVDTIQHFLSKNDIPGIAGIDTRALTKILREKGTMNGMITVDENYDLDTIIPRLKAYTTGKVVEKVSCREKEVLKGNGPKVALLDLGAKKNIARSLNERGCQVTIYPALTSAEEILGDNPDGIMLSNGPGDPKECTSIIKEIKKLYNSDVPIFAICLGHQLMALATGGDTHKMKYGHRGGNHPVKDLETGRVYISSQNHGYVVDAEGLEEKNIAHPAFVNVNDGTNEGMAYNGKNIFTVQGEYSANMLKQVVLGEKVEIEQPLQAPARPPILCPGCPHRGLFYCLHKLGVMVSGDIGCYTLGATAPLCAMDSTICMGASISGLHGFNKARGAEAEKKSVAVIGDSTFMHSGMTGLVNVAYNSTNSTVIILDNSITGMTGHQQNPTTGKNLKGDPAYAVDLEMLCHSLGIKSVRVVDPYHMAETEAVIKEELAKEEPSVIISRRPCALLKYVKHNPPLKVNKDKCVGCKQCLKIGCPAISIHDGKCVIDHTQCVGCGICKEMCKLGAICD